MSKAVLIYRLVKFERYLVFQVLEQHANLNGIEHPMYVGISSYAEIGSDYLYLRGYEESNNLKLALRRYINNAERDEHFDKIQVALIAFGVHNGAPVFIDAGNDTYILARE